MSQITTHILNTSEGKPAAGVNVSLHYENNGIRKKLSEAITDKDGRISDLLKSEVVADTGIYVLVFETGKYFKEKNTDCFYPEVQITFEVKDNKHYHIPLLISPYGYTTYRGS